jgi:hypothetical protein
MNKMRSLRDEMTAADRILEDEELVEYVFTGIGPEYDPIVSAVIARNTPSELYSQLLALETRLALMSAQEGGGSSASSAQQRGRGCGQRGDFGRGGGGCDGSTVGDRGGFNRGGHNSSSDKRPTCSRKFIN